MGLVDFRQAVFAYLLLVTAATVVRAAEPLRAIEFNRDVRPILADHCFQCHGPDAKQRKADLRLDLPEAVDANREGGSVVVAGQPEKSELWRRITSTDPDERMPPPDKGSKLTAAEIATLKQWIVEGGKFEKHWSLLPVRRPNPPDIHHSSFSIHNSIDAFVLARLISQGLTQSPEADRATLLRRATLGLTGLPPTPEEIGAFLADSSPDAYERVVDRLLASPRYGERMAVPWLDAARYADTSGYQSDGERFMWRWRDWVIEALNANMPFDQFTIEQIAGDLLPNPTLEQRIATGFNRNHRGNAEGGIIPEEYAVEYVADRVETTATVWLGLTLGCCRCHDHKYDPFTQRDFYSLFAFFNNVPEKGRAIKIGNSPPYIQSPTRQQEEERRRLEKEFEAAKRIWQAKGTYHVIMAVTWAETAEAKDLGDWHSAENLDVHLPLDGDGTPEGPQVERRLSSKSSPSDQSDVDLPGPAFVAGKRGQAARFDGKSGIVVGDVAHFGFLDKFSLASWVRVDNDGGGTIISRMMDVRQAEGYQLAIVDNKLQLNLVKRWLDDALRVETVEHLAAGQWHHVVATYDGSRIADGVRLYVDGVAQSLNVQLDELNQSFGTKEPLRVGYGGGAEGQFRGDIDDVRIYAGVISPDEARILATPETIAEIVATPAMKLSPGQILKLKAYYLLHHAPADTQVAYRNMKLAERALAEFEEKLPTVMVMEEMLHPRQTHVLLRGQYDKPGERVEPNVPAELPPLAASAPGATSGSSSSAPRNRLGLARWLVAAENPLTSRVIVNRVWQLHFGTGIVKTAEDFGRQGEWPSHPDLLDWLAAEFRHNWDVKRLHRAIVESATFRQRSGFRIQDSESASLNPEPRKNPRDGNRGALNPSLSDPDNRLLSRGPRLRLSAEMIRDQALFASGLLVEQLGGPSVRPLQPAGLWSELTGGDDYQPGSGADLYRRSLYTFWKRTIPPPTLATFDASSREACIVRESRTNTPLQALALMNEPTFVAAAQALAEQVIREADTPSERIERAMLHVVGRRPTKEEGTILLAAFERYRKSDGANDAKAYALVCSTIMNLDEAITSQ
jgi:mono/diheme cytochrome c family protein